MASRRPAPFFRGPGPAITAVVITVLFGVGTITALRRSAEESRPRPSAARSPATSTTTAPPAPDGAAAKGGATTSTNAGGPTTTGRGSATTGAAGSGPAGPTTTTAARSGGGSGSSPPPAASPSAAPGPTAPPTTRRTILSLRGSGSQSTRSFSLEGAWDLAWTWECGDTPFPSTFSITTVGPASVSTVDQHGFRGAGSKRYDEPGTHHLEIRSGCAWTVTVTAA